MGFDSSDIHLIYIFFSYDEMKMDEDYGGLDHCGCAAKHNASESWGWGSSKMWLNSSWLQEISRGVSCNSAVPNHINNNSCRFIIRDYSWLQSHTMSWNPQLMPCSACQNHLHQILQTPLSGKGTLAFISFILKLLRSVPISTHFNTLQTRWPCGCMRSHAHCSYPEYSPFENAPLWTLSICQHLKCTDFSTDSWCAQSHRPLKLQWQPRARRKLQYLQ